MKESRLRVGQGLDVHALAAGRELVLGGVRIPHDLGLVGHSDADVLTHAIIDALLGAAGCGDIGRLFPDTDARYADISSLVLLRRTCEMLDERHAVPVNVDAVVIAEKPRIAPYIEEMRTCLSHTMRMSTEQISLKATTTEGLGFVGHGQGIAAQAVALVRM